MAAEDTKDRMIAAALEVMRTKGYSGCTSRAIAAAGEFNQALIYYHFGGVDELLLAALDHSTERRLLRYRDAVADCSTTKDLVGVAAELYREDLEDGHITVLSEMIGGSLAHPELRSEMIDRMAPWVAFAEEQVSKAIGGSPLAGLVPTSALATAVVSFYLGIDLLSHLDPHGTRISEMFDSSDALAQLVDSVGS